jgi:hypothetical protein
MFCASAKRLVNKNQSGPSEEVGEERPAPGAKLALGTRLGLPPLCAGRLGLASPAGPRVPGRLDPAALVSSILRHVLHFAFRKWLAAAGHCLLLSGFIELPSIARHLGEELFQGCRDPAHPR